MAEPRHLKQGQVVFLREILKNSHFLWWFKEKRKHGWTSSNQTRSSRDLV